VLGRTAQHRPNPGDRLIAVYSPGPGQLTGTSWRRPRSVTRRLRQRACVRLCPLRPGARWLEEDNNAYMQNFLMAAPSIAKTSSFGSAARDGRVGMIDTGDVAAVAAEIAAPAAHAGKTYWPTGPEAITFSDAARVLSRVLGRESPSSR